MVTVITKIGSALKALVKWIPWNKVGKFLKWVGQFVVEIAKYSVKYGKIVLEFIQKNPMKIVNWFLDGVSVIEVIKWILDLCGY